jgi:hypothetical protein
MCWLRQAILSGRSIFSRTVFELFRFRKGNRTRIELRKRFDGCANECVWSVRVR